MWSREFVSCALAGLLFSVPLQADLFEASFSGHVESIDGLPGAPWDAVAVSDPFEFRFVFDSTVPDEDPVNPAHGTYTAIRRFDFMLGTVIETEPDPDGAITILDDDLVLAADAYIVLGAAPTLGGVRFTELLLDSSGTVFQSDVLPTNLDVLDFSAADMSLASPVVGDWQIFSPVESITINLVPEPTNVSLLALGGLFVARRRR